MNGKIVCLEIQKKPPTEVGYRIPAKITLINYISGRIKIRGLDCSDNNLDTRSIPKDLLAKIEEGCEIELNEGTDRKSIDNFLYNREGKLEGTILAGNYNVKLYPNNMG